MGLLKDSLLGFFPKSMRLPLWYYVKKYSGSLDSEIHYLRKRIPHDKVMIDVGANIGIYSFAFAPLCSSVVAFEPQHSCNEILSSFNSRKIKVFPVALSSRPGSMVLNIPVKRGSVLTGLASFREISGKCHNQNVEVATLDDYGFKDVGFIKIDVEGHEKEVISGGLKTIRSERPFMLIEIEQRYSGEQASEVFQMILNEGYRGGFLLNNVLHPLKDFSFEKYQTSYIEDIEAERYSRVKGKYICNFIFEPQERA